MFYRIPGKAPDRLAALWPSAELPKVLLPGAGPVYALRMSSSDRRPPQSQNPPEPPLQPAPKSQPKSPAKSPAKPPLPELLLPDAEAWRTWLAANHASSPGVQLILGRKGGTVTNLSYAGALQEALCFGWIDGQANKRDGESYLQRFTPRGRRSIWSLRNVGYVEQLEAAGRMHPSGRTAVEQAKADGRWDAAYAGPATAVMPADLTEAIAAVPEAQATYETLNSQNRYALFFRISTLKTAAARERRIEAIVRMLAAGETPYPQRRTP